MELETFVEEHRQEIDDYIHITNPNQDIDKEVRK